MKITKQTDLFLENVQIFHFWHIFPIWAAVSPHNDLNRDILGDFIRYFERPLGFSSDYLIYSRQTQSKA